MFCKFNKAFTQQEPIPEKAIARIVDILRSGRLHRYNTLPGENSEASLLEKEFADWQGVNYCLAVTSGGQAMQIALRAAGVTHGTKVLANAYTLAPVPGAIFATGGVPVLVEIDDNWHVDIGDLRAKALRSGAKYFLLSHMRGHIADMESITELCKEFEMTLIEDCAHTMGAKWKGIRSGNFGDIGCFSTQSYKHLNSGEGGFLTTNNPKFAARAVVASGSYMIYGSHGAIPPEEVFESIRLNSPNCSARLDNLRAAILRSQLPLLDDNTHRWNDRYHALEKGLRAVPGISVIDRQPHEEFVGSSIQFRATGIGVERIPHFIKNCAHRGVEIKWFGNEEPTAFTSRFDSWRYLGEMAPLPNTLRILSTTCDMRVSLTFSEQDCATIANIIGEEAARMNPDL
jgi:dTDP-4-amino-4,6-dideoxygalactose transaminase